MDTPDDPHDLDRFVAAQRGVYERALGELQRGRKTSHWMWFIFPQLAGLGSSAMAQRYAIASLAQARAYLAHPVLGARLRECTEAARRIPGGSAAAIFGYPDDLKLCSSLTLFEAAAPGDALFGQALDALCGGRRDPLTVQALARG